MKKAKLLTIILLLASVSILAQEQLRVELKNGTAVKGTLLEKVEGKVLRLKINKKDVQSFRWEDIDTVYAYSRHNSKNWQSMEKLFTRMADLKGNGYSGVFHMGLTNLVGSSLNTTRSSLNNFSTFDGSVYEGFYFHFTTAQGYQFNPHFALRIGTGVEFGSSMIVPFFGEIQLNALKRKITPMVLFSPGYGMCFDRESYSEYSYYEPLSSRGGGFYLAASAGVRFSFMQYMSMLLTFGGRYQTVSYNRSTPRIYGYVVRVSTEF